MTYRQRYICAYTVIGITLVGCAKPEPAPFVTAELPAIPDECTAQCPGEPRLPEQDITDLVAATDRDRLKRFGRCERQMRRVCADRLKVLLPPN